MKTAVEWLVEQLSKKTKDLKTELHVHCGEIIDQAKEMEKEQIIESYRTGKVNSFEVLNAGAVNMTAEQYYNETFKSE
jgi:hypothetical protein